MTFLTINNETTISNNPISNLNISVISGANINILTVTGPRGPSGEAGPAGTGIVNLSGYITTGNADIRYVLQTGGQYVNVNDFQIIYGRKVFNNKIIFEDLNNYVTIDETFIKSARVSDDNYNSIIDLDIAQLYSSGVGTELSLDWQTRQLFTMQSMSVPSVDWDQRILSGEWSSDTTGQNDLSLVTYKQLSSITGLANGVNTVLGVTTGQIVQILGNSVSGIAPVTISTSITGTRSIHGSTGALLGEPDGWWSILVSGRSARVPYYYA